MGAGESLPAPDERTLRTMEQVGITVQELRVFWRHFRRGDPQLRGFVDVDTFFRIFQERRSIYGDAIFELVDLKLQEIDFGGYLKAVTTYCLFEPEEILKFCFFVFDRDKNGYVTKDDLVLLVRILYGSIQGKERLALDTIDFDPDNRVDLNEFRRIYAQFPALFYPAFRIQLNFMAHTMGQRWWDRRKRDLYEDRLQKLFIESLPRRNELKRLERLREKRLRKKMGLCRYFCCAAQRPAYRRLLPILDDDDDDDHAERAAAAERQQQQPPAVDEAVDGRKSDNNLPNKAARQTPAWHRYQTGNKRPRTSSSDGRRRAAERAAAAAIRRAPKIRAAAADG